MKMGECGVGADEPAVDARLKYAFGGVFKNMAVLLFRLVKRLLHLITFHHTLSIYYSRRVLSEAHPGRKVRARCLKNSGGGARGGEERVRYPSVLRTLTRASTASGS